MHFALVSVHGEVARSDTLSAKAIDYARTHPARVLTLAVAKLGRFWSPLPLSAEFSTRRIYVVVGGLYCVPLFVLAIFGVWRGASEEGGAGAAGAGVILLGRAQRGGRVARYRVPCDVPLAVLAAGGLLGFRRNRDDVRIAATP